MTDAGIKELAPLTNLSYLSLGCTKVTDAGLKHLAPLKKLYRVYVNGTEVTEAGTTGFEKILPECKVVR